MKANSLEGESSSCDSKGNKTLTEFALRFDVHVNRSTQRNGQLREGAAGDCKNEAEPAGR